MAAIRARDKEICGLLEQQVSHIQNSDKIQICQQLQACNTTHSFPISLTTSPSFCLIVRTMDGCHTSVFIFLNWHTDFGRAASTLEAVEDAARVSRSGVLVISFVNSQMLQIEIRGLGYLLFWWKNLIGFVGF